jgi:hypothetical protein
VKIFAIYDDKSMAFQRPFPGETAGVVTRSLTDVVNDPNHEFCKYTEDFILHELGEFDERTGVITPCETGPVVVCRLSALKVTGTPELVDEAREAMK